MAYFPMFTDLSQKNVIVVGGGRIALLRAQKLALFDAKITVISNCFSGQYTDAFSELPDVTTLCESFCEAHLEKLCPAIVAVCPNEGTGLCPEEIHSLCIKKAIPVNVADVPSLCTFIFPSVIAGQKLSVGVSTSGCVPTAAAVLKERIDSVIPNNINEILDCLSEIRKRIYTDIPDRKLCKKILRKVTELCFERDGIISESELRDILKNET